MNQPPLLLRPQELDLVRAILRAHVPTHTVWAFGSRAGGQPKLHSDLDLAIIGTAPLPLGTLARLRDAFDEADLPWRVDLVDWAQASAAFRQIIARNRVVVQEANEEKDVESGGVSGATTSSAR